MAKKYRALNSFNAGFGHVHKGEHIEESRMKDADVKHLMDQGLVTDQLEEKEMSDDEKKEQAKNDPSKAKPPIPTVNSGGDVYTEMTPERAAEINKGYTDNLPPSREQVEKARDAARVAARPAQPPTNVPKAAPQMVAGTGPAAGSVAPLPAGQDQGGKKAS